MASEDCAKFVINIPEARKNIGTLETHLLENNEKIDKTKTV